MNTITTPAHLPDESVRSQTAASTPHDTTSGMPTTLNRLEWISIWIFWGFIAALTFLNTLVNDATSSSYHLPSIAPLTAALIDSLIWAGITPIIFKLTSRYSLDRPRWLLSLLLLIALGIVISIIVARIMAWVRYEQAVYFSQSMLQSGVDLGVFTPTPRRSLFFINEFIIFLVVLAAGFAHDYFLRYHLREGEARALETQAMQLRAELAETRLELLRSRLDPHFLFNTLNTVSSLVDSDARGARRMISQLSSLLRSSLEDKREREVTLERELAFLRRYLDIMQTRFQGRLIIVEDIAADALPGLVPTMLLQPLVENAIKHGIAKLDGVGRIEIHAARNGQDLTLSIVDNGGAGSQQHMDDEQMGAGMGLFNTRARLSQSYGERQSLQVNSNNAGGVTVQVAIPFHTELASLASS